MDRASIAGDAALVTGASRGIGLAIARQCAADGLDVAICARDADDVAEAADAIEEAYDVTALDAGCDVRDAEGVTALVDRATTTFGGLDLLVNNAGASFVAGFEDISENGWRSVVDVNLMGTVNCSRAAADALADGDGGCVVNVASVAGESGAPYMSHYGAAKAAVINLTRSLAEEWAGDDVRVNCVAPGYVATPGLATQMGIDADDVDRTEVDRSIGTSEEIADVVRFLASPAASFLTGETITPRGAPDIAETPEP